MDYLDDQHQLIKASQSGDQKATSALIEIHAPAVYGLLFHLCRDRALAEDLSQETFLRALQSLGKYEFRAPFRAWLFRIAVNLYRDQRRRSTVRKIVDQDVADEESLHLQSREAGPDLQIEQNERISQVYQALARLPEDLRMVVMMRDLQELSYSEISAALGWRLGTVKSRLFRARQELAELIRPYWEDKK
jgi:RNA polymerase sigma-70 factor, ECF subfamily